MDRIRALGFDETNKYIKVTRSYSRECVWWWLILIIFKNKRTVSVFCCNFNPLHSRSNSPYDLMRKFYVQRWLFVFSFFEVGSCALYNLMKCKMTFLQMQIGFSYLKLIRNHEIYQKCFETSQVVASKG